ncbi:MAG: lytic murein transglycosylase [Hyphomicrobiaceae bacterium]|nr:lytic murein transglycosylase [Hyphomicrobiaceae bacterium]
MNRKLISALLALSLTALAAPTIASAKCRTGNFQSWLSDIKRQAAAKGISRHAINSALDGVRYDPDVVRRDNAQGVFSQTYLQFAGRMVSAYRLRKGKQLIKKYRRTFSEIKRRYGVPAPVITAFWGLETDFGLVLGKSSTIRSLATLAYDCRRSELFHKELFSALKIIDRGDLSAREMRGPWAGELGQLQFLPSHYLHYGVDMDRDGHVNLLKSSPDALASAAKYIQSLGWRRNEPWLQEVRTPRSMDWAQASVHIKYSRAQWAKWGIRRANGRPLKADGLKAALVLPMGKDGPAFLAYSNFTKVYLEWNHSLTYGLTAGYFATRLGGAGKVHPGRGARGLKYAQIKQMQRLLQRRGFDVGKVDGILGSKSRSAIRKMQRKYGLAVDAYPTRELLARMR